MGRLQERLPLALITLGTAVPQLAAAQEGLEEIVVTAERRATTELKTPISIEVFTADDLATDRLQTVSDLQNATPNLSVNYSGFTAQSVNIRGVGNSVVNPNIQPGVAVFQDGLLMAETVVLQQGFLDVATVEVLRGPQGTFVGQSSTGGALRINSVAPDFDGVNGFVDVLFGNYRDQKLSGAVNLPLTDTVSTRFAFNQERRDSVFENIANQIQPDTELGRQPGRVEDLNLRASMLWQPNDSFSVLGRIEMNTSETDHTAPYEPNPHTFTNPNDPRGFGESQYFRFNRPSGSPTPISSGDTLLTDPYQLGYSALNVENLNQSDRYSVDVRRTFAGGKEFRSLTGYQHNNLRVVEDGDSTMANAVVNRNNVGPDNDYYSQEFNLLSPGDKRYSWIVGTSWFHRTTPVHLRIEDNQCGYQPTGVVNPCTVPVGGLPRQSVLVSIETIQRHAGIFGQFTWDFSDQLELQVGARNSFDNNIDTQSVHVGILVPPVAAAPCPDPVNTATLPGAGASYLCIPIALPFGGRTKYKESTPTYKIGLNWTPGDNQFIYGFFARGYKSGGVNGGTPFDRELVDDYEIGWKTTALDGRMQVQLGAFRMEYQQMQQPAFLIRPFSSGFNSAAGVIQNIGDSTIQGVELSVNAAFGGLGLNFSAGYTDSELGAISTVDTRLLSPLLNFGGGAGYVPGCGPGQAPYDPALGVPPVPGVACFNYTGVSLSGTANLYSPELSYTFSLDYAFPLSTGAVIRPRIGFSHQDESFSSLFQTDNYFRIDDRDLVNVSVSYEAEAWSLQAFCINCSDETYLAAVTNTNAVYGTPRMAGVRFNRRF